jgi:hypothetical protein
VILALSQAAISLAGAAAQPSSAPSSAAEVWLRTCVDLDPNQVAVRALVLELRYPHGISLWFVSLAGETTADGKGHQHQRPTAALPEGHAVRPVLEDVDIVDVPRLRTEYIAVLAKRLPDFTGWVRPLLPGNPLGRSNAQPLRVRQADASSNR